MVRFLGIVILIYLFFRILGKFILPFIAKSYVNKQKQRYYQENPNATQDKERDGEIHIRRAANRKQKVNPEIGEVVEFEEVEDDS